MFVCGVCVCLICVRVSVSIHRVDLCVLYWVCCASFSPCVCGCAFFLCVFSCGCDCVCHNKVCVWIIRFVCGCVVYRYIVCTCVCFCKLCAVQRVCARV